MTYLVQKHQKGLAIIHWEFDPYPKREEDDLGLDYCVSWDIYDYEGNLLHEDAIGYCQIISSQDNRGEFHKEIIEVFEFHNDF